MSNVEVGKELIQRTVMVHLDNFRDKFNMIMYVVTLVIFLHLLTFIHSFMLKKLYSVVDGTSAVDNLDSTMNHEVLMGGYFYSTYMKAKFQEWIFAMKGIIEGDVRRRKLEADFVKSK
jgi:DNA-directed RNA polymerase I subunit RPA2